MIPQTFEHPHAAIQSKLIHVIKFSWTLVIFIYYIYSLTNSFKLWLHIFLNAPMYL